MFTKRAAVIAVVVAFLTGLVASLAVRPPGAAAAPVLTSGGDSQPVRLRWRVPLSSARNLPGSGETPVWVAASLLASTDGAVRLDLYDPGEVVDAFAVTDAARDRKVEAGFTWLGYDQGKMPASALFGATPFGLDPWAYIGWWHFGDGAGYSDTGHPSGRALAEAIYAKHSLMPLLCGISGPETAGWFRTPLVSADDVEGLKIRFAGLGGKVMQRVGASVTMLPAGEIFQALETGVIDATEFSQPITDQALGFDRIAKHNHFPGWHQPFSATHFVVNLAVWESLPEADRALLRATCDGAVARSLGLTEAIQGPVLQRFAARGVSTHYLPDELLQTLKAASDEVLDDEAARDADFKAVLDSQRAFQAVYSEWRRLAYLPKDWK